MVPLHIFDRPMTILRRAKYPTLFCAFLIGLFFAGETFGDRYKNTLWFSGMLEPFLINMLATFAVLFLGYNRLVKHLDQQAQRRELGSVIDFWSFQNPSRGFLIIYGGELGSFIDDTRTQSSLSTIYSIARIEEILRKIYGNSISIETKSVGDIKDLSNYRQRYIIILGGYLSIPQMKEAQTELGLPFVQDFDHPPARKIMTQSLSGGAATWESLIENGPVRMDYALVTRLAAGGASVLWFSGNSGLGTYGSVLFFTSPNPTEDGTKFPVEGARQFIIEVQDIQDNKIDASHRAFHVWQNRPFNLNPTTLMKFISKTTFS